jgi:hypothetical protein
MVVDSDFHRPNLRPIFVNVILTGNMEQRSSQYSQGCLWQMKYVDYQNHGLA